MKSSDLFYLSIKNLWRRKLRTFLTVFGVVIGTASIVIMVSLGIAMNQNFTNEISKMGSLKIINVNKPYGMGMNGQDNSALLLDNKAIADFEALSGVEIASPIVDLDIKMTADKFTSYVHVRGMKPEIYDFLDLTTSQGRLLTSTDEMAIMFGSNMAFNFYNPKKTNMYGGMWGMGNDGVTPPPVDLMTAKLKFSYDMMYGEKKQPGQVTVGTPPKPQKITSVGILNGGTGEYDYNAYMTLEQAEKLMKEKNKYDQSLSPGSKISVIKGYQSAIVSVKDIDNVKTVLQSIKDMGFEAYSLTEYLESMQKTSAGLQAILGGIGAVSLLVAAIGITNTMVMSIYERTKEIGVMKVIGASIKDIKKMFLTEAAMIGFLGGVLGILISYGGSYILNKLGSSGMNILGGYMGEGSKMSVIPLWLYAASVGFTTIVGLVSGYFPARRAMKLSVLQALRTE